MSEIRPAVAKLLAERFPGAPVAALAGDASTRRFLRVQPVGRPSLIVMDYGQAFEQTTDDVVLAQLFLEAGLPVARVLETHPAAGCLVLEDLGPDTLEDVLTRVAHGSTSAAQTPEALYRQAARLAAGIASRGTPVLAASARAAGPSLDAERFRFEMGFFVTHFVRGLLGAGGKLDELKAALDDLAVLSSGSSRPVLCHRDYHSRNLMVRSDGSLAMVDIQDARWGPDTYDLASLLFDAYVDVPGEIFRSAVAEFLEALPSTPDANEFRRRLDLVAAQRMIKALGTFGYQVASLGKARYRAGIPRTLARLERLLPAVPVCVPIHREFERLGVYTHASRNR